MNKKAAEMLKLRQKLIATEAYDIARLKRSYSQVDKASEDYFMASGVIITIVSIEGEFIVEPTLIADGLGKELVAALKQEILSTSTARIHLSTIKE